MSVIYAVLPLAAEDLKKGDQTIINQHRRDNPDEGIVYKFDPEKHPSYTGVAAWDAKEGEPILCFYPGYPEPERRGCWVIKPHYEHEGE